MTFDILHNLIRKARGRIHRRSLSQRFGASAARPDRLVWIDPSDVEYKVLPFFTQSVPNDSETYVFDGDWDSRFADSDRMYPQDFDGLPDQRLLLPVENLDWYRSFEAHFDRGVPWEETIVYKRRIDEGFQTSRYDSVDGMLERLSDLDQLYDHLASKGYLTQEELAQREEGPISPRGWQHEVEIDIGRHGDLFLDDGRNRLMIAKLLSLREIPVRILVRHEGWQRVREAYADASSPEDLSEDLWEYRNHPDLTDVIDTAD
ncbi:hypothetical protein OB905_10915 [Halobacteria archaeon AArc-dxtr1]|nr:hypothetical protein [Halobacteria archaeon AArc-dxtr1]